MRRYDLQLVIVDKMDEQPSFMAEDHRSHDLDGVALAGPILYKPGRADVFEQILIGTNVEGSANYPTA